MKVLDRFQICRNKDRKESNLDFSIKQEHLDLFISLVNMDDVTRIMFNEIDSAEAYFKMCKDFSGIIKSIIGIKGIEAELFYALKLGYSYKEFPHELIYIVNKALNQYKYPNFALSKIHEKTLTKFYNRYDDLISIEVLLSRLCKYEVKLLSPYRQVVHGADGLSEMYIASTGDIIVLPTDIAKSISISDIKQIQFSEELGFCIDNIPLRTLNGKLGVVQSDFIMTEVV